MSKSSNQLYYKIGGLATVLAVATGFVAVSPSGYFSADYSRPEPENIILEDRNVANEEDAEVGFIVQHIATPDPVKAIYMTQCVAGTKSFRDQLVKIAETTEINSIVIDIKDYSGKIGFKTDNPKLSFAVSDECRAGDLMEFIGTLHEKGIYVIGRITVFQDPFMTKIKPEIAVRKISDGGVWKDRKGLSFVDVGAREHWDYIVELSKESHKIGFDEINFDYIRFPSDGDMSDVDYTLSRGKAKPEALEEFFVYLRDELEPTGMVTSADLFGMVTTNRDDLNIGQVLERALPYFDYIAPMVYPSHYPPKFNGYSDPNKYPYEIVKYAMDGAVERAKAYDASFGTSSPQFTANSYKKMRPWLQDFDYGGDYDVEEVRAQIRATYDAGLTSWMLWSPSNRYTLGALDKE